MVGHGQVEAEQGHDRADQASGLAQGEAEHGLKRQGILLQSSICNSIYNDKIWEFNKLSVPGL